MLINPIVTHLSEIVQVSRGLIQARVRCVIWPLSRLRHLQKGLLADQQERLTIIDECNVT